jgi:hypothetical protein
MGAADRARFVGRLDWSAEGGRLNMPPQEQANRREKTTRWETASDFGGSETPPNSVVYPTLTLTFPIPHAALAIWFDK